MFVGSRARPGAHCPEGDAEEDLAAVVVFQPLPSHSVLLCGCWSALGKVTQVDITGSPQSQEQCPLLGTPTWVLLPGARLEADGQPCSLLSLSPARLCPSPRRS